MQVYWTCLVAYFAYGSCQLQDCTSGQSPTNPYQTVRRSITNEHLPDGALGGDGKKAPREKACYRKSIPGQHSTGPHTSRQQPDIWNIKDEVFHSLARHTIQVCDCCSHAKKNQGHPPLVPVESLGTSCPLGRKYQIATSAAQIQEVVDVLAMPGATISVRKQIVKEIIHGLKHQMARGSILSSLILDDSPLTSENDCARWRQLAASLGVAATLPSSTQISEFRQLFKVITADMLAAYESYTPCSAKSLKGVWDHRADRGVRLYAYYEKQWEDHLLQATGFRGKTARKTPWLDIFLVFSHAVISICQGGGEGLLSRQRQLNFAAPLFTMVDQMHVLVFWTNACRLVLWNMAQQRGFAFKPDCFASFAGRCMLENCSCGNKVTFGPMQSTLSLITQESVRLLQRDPKRPKVTTQLVPLPIQALLACSTDCKMDSPCAGGFSWLHNLLDWLAHQNPAASLH